jgi:hypothetical protein
MNDDQDQNGNYTQRTIRHTKQPSFSELTIGRNKIKQLPENFFEKVLDIELKLKREFTMNTLQELVNLYSVLIIILFRSL